MEILCVKYECTNPNSNIISLETLEGRSGGGCPYLGGGSGKKKIIFIPIHRQKKKHGPFFFGGKCPEFAATSSRLTHSASSLCTCKMKQLLNRLSVMESTAWRISNR